MISTINTRPKCGKTLQKHQLLHAHLPFPKIPIQCPYAVQACKPEDHQVECTQELCLIRKYHSILLLKKDLKRLADAAIDCFQVRFLYLTQAHIILWPTIIHVCFRKPTLRLKNTNTTEIILFVSCASLQKSLSLMEVLEWTWILILNNCNFWMNS